MRDLRELWSDFDRFGGALLGLANEQSDFFREANGYEGFNGGVQLLDLAAMRSSHRLTSLLDHVGHGVYGSKLGHHGDQTIYTHMRAIAPELFYQLGCEWNRQVAAAPFQRRPRAA